MAGKIEKGQVGNFYQSNEIGIISVHLNYEKKERAERPFPLFSKGAEGRGDAPIAGVSRRRRRPPTRERDQEGAAM